MKIKIVCNRNSVEIDDQQKNDFYTFRKEMIELISHVIKELKQ